MGLLALVSTTVLTGCGVTTYVPGFISPYRYDIQQGNFITQEMVAQLKPGMTRDQVRFALGTPLIADAFHSDRWDYVYRLQKADGKVEFNRYSVNFKDNLLTTFGGSELPTELAAAPAALSLDDPITAPTTPAPTPTPTTAPAPTQAPAPAQVPVAILNPAPVATSAAAAVAAVGGTETAPELVSPTPAPTPAPTLAPALAPAPVLGNTGLIMPPNTSDSIRTPAAATTVPVLTEATGKVLSYVDGWSQAWSNKDVNNYLAFYATNFKHGMQSRLAWENFRRKRLSAPASIKIDVINPVVDIQPGGRAIVTFEQHYKSDLLEEHGNKTLEMVNFNGVWKITKETFVLTKPQP